MPDRGTHRRRAKPRIRTTRSTATQFSCNQTGTFSNSVSPSAVFAIVAIVAQLQVLHCVCGATREAPIGLRVLSCARCGRALALATPNAFVPIPARSIVATATLASQLLGMLAFALALVWIVKQGDRQPVSVTILVLGVVCVFAGGNAHRGSLRALALCALLDLAIAIACLANISAVQAFVVVPVAWAAPAVVHELAIATMITGVVAALAASACIAAVPQTRRFAAWRDEQLVRAARGTGTPYPGAIARLR